MPWLLDGNLARDECGNPVSPDWRFVLEPKPPTGFRSLTFIPTAEDLKTPIHVELLEDCDRLGDFLRAPDGGGNIVVSRAFKDLAEAFEPEQHYFLPLAVKHLGGLVESDTHFLFKMGGFVDDGIILTQSDVRPRKFNPNGLYATEIPPRLMWRARSVHGRHIWADARLEDHIVVSDELMSEIKANDLSGYVAKESRIDSTR